ncbi:adenine-specific methyltransferase [Paramecium bursaria Chlorella virus KS1B]|nr:adenine-specific methyltransferase [Paramecium bursaria Chlorella virus KS1B]
MNTIETYLSNDDTSMCRNDITTPMGLVREIVDAIPDRIYRDGMKILDPCVGMGNFLIYLRDKVNSMSINAELIGTDINPARIKIARELVPEATILEKSFFDMQNDLYDIIIANPPYAKITDGKRASKNHNIFPEFILKSIDMLSNGGAIVFLCPTSWMSLSDRNVVSQKLTELNMTRLDIGTSKKWFSGVGSSFSWFICVKEPHCGKTNVSGKFGKYIYNENVELRNERFIPLLCSEMAMNIVKKMTGGKDVNTKRDKLVIETSSDLHAYTKKTLLNNERSDEFPWKCIHTKRQTKWSSRPHKYQDGVKVFICLSSTYETWVDTCGMTQSVAFVRCENEEQAKEVKEFLDSLAVRFVVAVTRYGNFTNIRVLQKLSRDVEFTPEEIEFMIKFV